MRSDERTLARVGSKLRVVAHAPVVAAFAQHRQEVPLAGADLDQVTVSQVVATDQPISQRGDEIHEAGRVVQRVLVAGVVGDQGGVECPVPQVAGNRRIAQLEVAAGSGERFGLGLEQGVAEDGQLLEPDHGRFPRAVGQPAHVSVQIFHGGVVSHSSSSRLRSRTVSMHCQKSAWRYAISCPSLARFDSGSRSNIVSSPAM